MQLPSSAIPAPCREAAFVRFFGPGNCAWVSADERHLAPFSSRASQCSVNQVKKALRRKWKKAVEEAETAVEEAATAALALAHD